MLPLAWTRIIANEVEFHSPDIICEFNHYNNSVGWFYHDHYRNDEHDTIIIVTYHNHHESLTETVTGVHATF